LIHHKVVLGYDIVEYFVAVGIGLLHIVAALLDQQRHQLSLRQHSGSDFHLTWNSLLKLLTELVHHLPQSNVKLLAELSIIVAGQVAAHSSYLVVANSNSFQLWRVQVLVNHLLWPNLGQLWLNWVVNLGVIDRLLFVDGIFFNNNVLDLPVTVTSSVLWTTLLTFVKRLPIDRQPVKVVNVRQQSHNMVYLTLFK
jgi:hypothetical protein